MLWRASRSADFPMIAFNRPSFIGRELEYISEAIERGQLSGDGHFSKRCEAIIEQLTGAGSALLTHSCTAALEMAAILAGIGPGDEVIMPSFTFVSTANAVVLRGGCPVFVDIDPQTLNINPEYVSRAVTDRTKAIFAVHYAGIPADMDRLAEIARAHDLTLVEDAAQALGSSYRGRKAGSLGDLAAFSFHETKNIVSGEGGALTINRPELVERAEIIREKGTNRARYVRGKVDKYTWVDIGSSFLPGELIAAFLLAQLEHADAINERRLEIADAYRHALTPYEASGRIQLPAPQAERTGNGHMFYVLLRNRRDRDAFIAGMQEQDVTTPFHYVPLHSSPAGLRMARASGTMAVTDDISSRLVRLPLFYSLDGEAIARVIGAAEVCLGSQSGG